MTEPVRTHPWSRTRRALPSLALCALLLPLLGACTAANESPATPEVELLAIPAPDLADAEPAVRQQLTEKLAEVEALAAEARTNPAAAAEGFGDLGLLYILYDFLEASETSFENAERLADDDHRWPYLRGYLLQVQGRLTEATPLLARAVELEPTSLPALLRLGRARLELGEIDEAKALFTRALDLDSEAPAALEGLGKAAEAQGEEVQAAGYFERALELEPRATSLNYALGQLYRRLGRDADAQAQLALAGDVAVRIPDPLLNPLASQGRSAQFFAMQAASAMDETRWQDAAGAWERALELDPTSFEARRGLSYCLHQTGDVEGAITTLAEARPHAETLAAAERAELFRLLGGLQVLADRDAEATSSFQQSLTADEAQPVVRAKLANALARQGQLQPAVDQLDLILSGPTGEALSPEEEADLTMRRATLLVNLNRRQEALADFETAIRLDPNNPQLRSRYAEALSFMGQNQQAQEAQAQADSITQNPTERSRVISDRARRQISAGRHEEGLASLDTALSFDEGNLDARQQRAEVLAHLARFDEAIPEFLRVLESVPTHGPAHRGVVIAMILNEQWGEARAQLQKALAQFPRDVQLATLQARLLATAPAPDVRDGNFALELSRRIYERYPSARAKETIALAAAAAGLYKEAAVIQEALITEVAETADAEWKALLEKELAAFREEKGWAVGSPKEILDAAFRPSPGGP